MSELYGNLLYFLGFSIVAVCLYWMTPSKNRSAVLLCNNILFYVLCAGWYVGFVLLTGLWSFLCAKKIDTSKKDNSRKMWLTWGIVPIILTLCVFKYWTPAWSIVGRILSEAEGYNFVKVVLPLGMSYYILKSISYIIDVYKRKINSEGKFVDYLAYISFYGQIVSGPIQRYEQWVRENRREKPVKTCINGYYHIMAGLFMKLVIANRLSEFVDKTFAAPDAANGLQLWLGFFFYAIYIYCDFAGYSHIAIGVTNCHGMDCIDNFDKPYFSRNIREFWNHWHISLSSWLKDYVYIPLGGNRKGKIRRVLNVMITFLVCGIWHGSTMSFIVWGGYHGIANILTKKTKEKSYSALNNIIHSIWTFVIVAAGWIFFASATLEDAFAYFWGMITRVSINETNIQAAISPFANNNTCVALFLTALLFVIVLLLKEANDVYMFLRRTRTTSFVWQVFVVVSILLFSVFGANQFIYAGF